MSTNQGGCISDSDVKVWEFRLDQGAIESQSKQASKQAGRQKMFQVAGSVARSSGIAANPRSRQQRPRVGLKKSKCLKRSESDRFVLYFREKRRTKPKKRVYIREGRLRKTDDHLAGSYRRGM